MGNNCGNEGKREPNMILKFLGWNSSRRRMLCHTQSLGDRLVREPGDTGPWPGEFTGLRLGKTPWKVKREERDR